MKEQNIIDRTIIELMKNFQSMPDLLNLQKSKLGRDISNFYLKEITEVKSFQSLVLSSFIPATQKDFEKLKKEIISSKFVSFLKLTPDDLLENMYETIRFAYVGLFHKYESFIEGLFELLKNVSHSIDEGHTLNVESEIEVKLGNFRHWYKYHTVSKINYISNSYKHSGGYPLTKHIPLSCQHFQQNKKIRLNIKDFERDSNKTMEIYQQVFILLINCTVLLVLEKGIMISDNDRLEFSDFTRTIDASNERAFMVMQEMYDSLLLSEYNTSRKAT